MFPFEWAENGALIKDEVLQVFTLTVHPQYRLKVSTSPLLSGTFFLPEINLFSKLLKP